MRFLMVQCLSWAYAEGMIFKRVMAFNRGALMSQAALLIGFAYLVGPVDFIPGRVPFFGHLDEAGFLVGGLLVARWLAPREGRDHPAFHGASFSPAAPAAARTVLPNFFIVGAARCGTTSLFDAICQHPDVFCCPVKEPNHFATELNERPSVVESARRRGVLIAPGFAGMTVLPRVAITPDYTTYLQLFEGWRGEHAIGEASTAYLMSPRAAAAIAQRQPAARIIAVLRQPVRRALSELQMHAQLGQDAETTDEKTPAAISASRYAPQIARYLQAFPREQILFVIFEEMLANTQAILASVFTHIGVDPAPGAAITLTHHNQSRSVRFARLNELLFRSGLRDVMVHTLPTPVRRAIASRYYKAAPEPSPQAPAVPAGHSAPAVTLDLFRDDIAQTSAMIQKDLSHWLV